MEGTNDSNVARKQFGLLRPDSKVLDENEIGSTPVFTEAVRQHGNDSSKSAEPTFTQYGLLGGIDAKLRANQDFESTPDVEDDPRVYYNIKAPSSIFICGCQGSGKSHTLSCLLENCLIPSAANTLPRPLTGIVFHYDPFFSGARGEPCEAAFISSDKDVKVRVLCPPTNVQNIRDLYGKLPNVEVQVLRISQEDLNTKRMLDLMAVNSIQGGGMPLYLHVVTRILRDLRTQQQQNGGTFDYRAFRRAIELEGLTPGQKAPLEQRLDTLESFMAKEHVARNWFESACALFNICLSLFLEKQSHDIGRVVALDEAHKYMTDSAECQTLTESLLSTIRLQRHLGARIIIATQEPTVSPKLLDLCSVTLVHRFTSPSWLSTIKKHLAGAMPGNRLGSGEDEQDEEDRAAEKKKLDHQNELLDRIVALRQGEALMFCPSAVVGVKKPKRAEDVDQITDGFAKWSIEQNDKAKKNATDGEPTHGLAHLSSGIMKIRIRERITEDGGKSVMAG
ncbi:P-loop containing nucleoside triphosphate hydrolase [Pochonia chlamydosporia 170]|uniref:P-loop containing nucleoside triphosphate hydrolase n=1 Tax=Pochonia chlamydosporia 170 TaxID=1380566 RepID=A0A179FA48_METCM|nr:P-loop containing nucleoside triphosphate hydrolase [Pochonia chlamydosporia 170]OAQ62161.1 P-loop containing nucleoside triphosphate hydrolase [Pochonia chlamydosporia 170]